MCQSAMMKFFINNELQIMCLLHNHYFWIAGLLVIEKSGEMAGAINLFRIGSPFALPAKTTGLVCFQFADCINLLMAG